MLPFNDVYENAIADCDKVIELDSRAAGAYYNKACALANLDQLEEGIASLKKAITLDKTFIERAKEDDDLYKLRANKEFK